jgi:hypothetical protein
MAGGRDERRGARPRGEPARRPPPPGPRPRRAWRTRPSRNSRPRCSCSTTGSSIAGWRGDLTSSCLDALDPSAWGRLFPRGLLRESPTLVEAGRGRGPAPAPTDSPRRPQGGPGGKPSVKPGPLRWAEARHAPSGSRGCGRPLLLRSANWKDVGSRRSAGSAIRKAFAGRWSRLGGTIRVFRAFPITTPIPPADVAELGLVVGRRRGRSHLDHPEGFGEAARGDPGADATPRAPDRPGFSRACDSIMETALVAAPASGEMIPGVSLRKGFPCE